MIWNQLLAGPDQMRKRMALALSEFFVVSLSPIDGFYPPYVIGAYWDVLSANAFGNFRTLLERITLNAGMGFFLNTKGNLKEDANGRQPDENYAREVMQLFTIGLYELNPDGTRPARRQQPAHRNLRPERHHQPGARVHRLRLGLPIQRRHVHATWPGTTTTCRTRVSPPTRCVSTRTDHSNLAVSFLGTNIPANTAGPEALRIALDTLFNHANTGPFFARQMIQRLVTSNPSPAYVGRVAAAFANNGSGVRGDLKAVWTAILTDDGGARCTGGLRHAGRQTARARGALRAMGAHGGRELHERRRYEIYDLSGSDVALGQSPLRSPSVFNFFRPGYVPPNTAIATAGKQAPEFQLLNETTTAGYINFLQWATRGGYNDVKPTYAAAAADRARRAGRGRLAESQAHRQPALAGFALGDPEPRRPRSTSRREHRERQKLDMLATAAWLMLCSPEYLVQK